MLFSLAVYFASVWDSQGKKALRVTFLKEFLLVNPKKQQQCPYPVVWSEGLYKGIYSTILHQENYNTSKAKIVFLGSIMLPSRTMRDTERDPDLPSSIPVVQHMDGNTNSKSYSHRKPEIKAFTTLAIRMNYIPVRNQKYRFLICWQ